MPSEKSSKRSKPAAPDPADDWQFLAHADAAKRFRCGVATIQAMVKFKAGGVLPSFPSIGSRDQVCPELMKRWLLEMASTEEGRGALRDFKVENRHS